ncbi:helix-turn-helix transcriptional regulator [Methylobacterium currus]|uniref:AraC family transcriptional regulator n=1 Tax=Methylobacterium currus TaxID=2051553 RepID=UPI001E539277|nr:helix-turn-helix transcriptional regulator [Methylobacterium currus]UHC17868.1 helix-turn-helix transcriptional regulator [Methylobacterium currus]
MHTKSTNPEDYEKSRHSIVAMPKEYPSGFHVRSHVHQRSQLIHATAGVMEVMTADGLWLLPPQRGVWMPGGIAHEMRAKSDVSLRTLYIAGDACPGSFPEQPRAVRVSTLLRELILRVARMPLERERTEHEQRVLDLLLYEITWEADGVLHLPMPKDKRLAGICRALIDNPGDGRNLEEWAALAGASSRTLARLFKREFGSNFLLWRKQVRALSAIPRLAASEPVGIVAADLGYETPGAFTAMFRRMMGENPSRYFDADIPPQLGDPHLILSDLA